MNKIIFLILLTLSVSIIADTDIGYGIDVIDTNIIKDVWGEKVNNNSRDIVTELDKKLYNNQDDTFVGILRVMSEIQTNIIKADSISVDTLYANIYQSPPRWNDMRTDGTAFRGGVTALTLKNYNSTGIYLLAIGKADEGHVGIQMPHSWVTHDTISPHIHISHSTQTAETIVLQIDYIVAGINNTFSTVYSDSVSVYANDKAAWTHRIAEFDDFYLDCGVSCFMQVKISRLNIAADNYSGDVFIHGFDIHYRIDDFGSRQEYTK